MKPVALATAWTATHRVEFFYVGLLGGLGLTLPQFLRDQARAELKNIPGHAPVAQSVIHIFLPGGIAHQESFDPKPFALTEYQGRSGPSIPLPGVKFSEFMKDTAQFLRTR